MPIASEQKQWSLKAKHLFRLRDNLTFVELIFSALPIGWPDFNFIKS
ncbi:hypothetical protein HMPREF1989_01864 [Porphyromonas gingivalis F0566]|nr:hypothetical protein HMPREF1553_02052 [Porphyromonas gingivalis F0568]ERJ84343.1 hypothetical protein HMPREF1989_01864 [Porphyromonas gingivalis F0566]